MNESMGILGRKVGMTQMFHEDGTVIPVTVVEAGPCTVLQVKTKASKDKYAALQLGFGSKKDKHATRADVGHAKAAGLEKVPAHVEEIRVPDADAGKFQRGQQIVVGDVFKVGEKIDIVGTSKGRGFAGVMKKYHFKGFERSHGCHEYFRHGGSIGTRLTPGMTLAGKRMPGQMGNVQVTVQNIEVVKIDAERNLIYLRGGVPGAKGAFLAVRHAAKAAKAAK